ncbi:MAG: hypothetical protein HYS89_02235 [Candidatus Colwellbacteria bacterium]|nr:hypothetical protein [Candidatus Colwellbacteria bacterium]
MPRRKWTRFEIERGPSEMGFLLYFLGWRRVGVTDNVFHSSTSYGSKITILLDISGLDREPPFPPGTNWNFRGRASVEEGALGFHGSYLCRGEYDVYTRRGWIEVQDYYQY